MYDKFTDRSRKVFQLANVEAQRCGHEYLGTEHILCGLIKEGSGVAAHVLVMSNLTLQRVRTEFEKLVQFSTDQVVMGKLPQTPRAKRAVELAMKAAQDLNHNFVGTEHILLGLLDACETDDTVAATIIRNLGCEPAKLRQSVLHHLGIPSVEKMTFSLTQLARTPGHVFAAVFANGANCGTLTMTPEEFGRFAELIENGALQSLLNVDVTVVTAKEAEERS
jgi:ATP-dependent Clp protease ATP-binding subunit ClpA